jgi:hypothetical protein
MATVALAQAGLAEKVAAVVDETVGADSEAGRAVVSSFDLRFGTNTAEDADENADRGSRGGR